MKLDIQMFAVPFRKVSKTRKRMRRSHNAMEIPGMTKCPSCGEMIKPHRVCPKCGSYNIDYLTRIIGYLKRVSSFNDARQVEEHMRSYRQ